MQQPLTRVCRTRSHAYSFPILIVALLIPAAAAAQAERNTSDSQTSSKSDQDEIVPAAAAAQAERNTSDSQTSSESDRDELRLKKIEQELAALKAKAKQQEAQEKKLLFEDTQIHKLLRDPANERSRQHAHWIRVPKIDTEVRFGGFVQLNVLYDTAAMGQKDGKFKPSTIVVPTNPEGNTAVDVNRSRFIFQSRSKTPWGDAHTFFSTDWAGGTGMTPTFRMRQFYAHIGGLIFGQANSLFTDAAMWPDTFDTQGPNGMPNKRRPLVAYGWSPLRKPENLILTISVENPSSQVNGPTGTEATGLVGMPDLVGRIDFNTDLIHLAAAGLLRQIRAESSATGVTDDLWAGAGTLAAKLTIPGTNGHVLAVQATGGNGASTQINDTSGLEQDGVWNETTSSIEGLTSFAFHGAYHFVMTEWLRANAIAGYVLSDTVDIQTDDAFKETIYANGNLIFTPISHLDIGLQYYYGQRKNKDDQVGRTHRVMGSAHFAF